MSDELVGKRIAFLVANSGVEHAELTPPGGPSRRPGASRSCSHRRRTRSRRSTMTPSRPSPSIPITRSAMCRRSTSPCRNVLVSIGATCTSCRCQRRVNSGLPSRSSSTRPVTAGSEGYRARVARSSTATWCRNSAPSEIPYSVPSDPAGQRNARRARLRSAGASPAKSSMSAAARSFHASTSNAADVTKAAVCGSRSRSARMLGRTSRRCRPVRVGAVPARTWRWPDSASVSRSAPAIPARTSPDGRGARPCSSRT
jgi:hypothetical protein